MATQTERPTDIFKAIEETLRTFVTADQVGEIRAPKYTENANGDYAHTRAGFFNADGIKAIAKDAWRLERFAPAVYFTFNPVKPILLARCANEIKKAPRGAFCAEDTDIVCRRWILVDADPVRPAGISSTDAEKALAARTIQDATAYLDEAGFGLMVQADSGNGHHVLLAADLPADDAGMVEAFLHVLAAEFDTDACRIDTTVHNPARITKLYGTLVKKGSDITDRPHRRSKLGAIVNRDRGRVGTEQLAAFLVAKDAVEINGTWYAPGKVPTSKGAKSNGNSNTAGSKKAASSNGRASSNGFHVRTGPRARVLRRAQAYVDKIPDSVEGQNGSDPTFSVCLALYKGFLLTDTEARPILDAYNRERCRRCHLNPNSAATSGPASPGVRPCCLAPAASPTSRRGPLWLWPAGCCRWTDERSGP